MYSKAPPRSTALLQSMPMIKAYTGAQPSRYLDFDVTVSQLKGQGTTISINCLLCHKAFAMQRYTMQNRNPGIEEVMGGTLCSTTDSPTCRSVFLSSRAANQSTSIKCPQVRQVNDDLGYRSAKTVVGLRAEENPAPEWHKSKQHAMLMYTQLAIHLYLHDYVCLIQSHLVQSQSLPTLEFIYRYPLQHFKNRCHRRCFIVREREKERRTGRYCHLQGQPTLSDLPQQIKLLDRLDRFTICSSCEQLRPGRAWPRDDSEHRN